jgi:hypothetical protein
MIKIEPIAPDILRIVAPVKLKSDDFAALAAVVDPLLKLQPQIRLLIDATHLEGWENLTALERHAGFVKNHQDKVDRIAVIARHEWQHWLVGAVRVFLHPKVEVFDPGHEAKAMAWLRTQGA